VTGPLVRAAQLYRKGDKATALPGAVAPEGAGAADEPWDESDPGSGESEEESEKEPESDEDEQEEGE
jgi:hypothetical protein